MGLDGWAAMVLLCASMSAAAHLPGVSPTQSQAAPGRDRPTLSRRPVPDPGVQAEGKIKLDVVVTDAAGRPVSGLQKSDFTLFDNKKPRPILSFRASDGSASENATAHPDPRVKVILLIDFANTSLQRAAYTRLQVEDYLRQNGGHLPQPTSVMLFFDQGIKGQQQPSTDGNLLANQLEQSMTATHNIPLTKGYDELELLSLSLRSLGSIAAAEDDTPGRKLLIWIGPGWPLLDSSAYRVAVSGQRQLFNAVVELTQELRESRVTMYSIFPIDPALNDPREAKFYRSYLKGVISASRIEPANVALPVFAIHSGGRALDTAGDLPTLIDSCVREATAYYTLTFDPASAKHVDEYHELSVHLDQPQFKARTSTGYYVDPPFELPALSIQH